ncbi:hypothetical protein ECH_0827 [Ehrlichia chaffeensis str. Arkansas]|uniref:Uncharacterized protein n=1 Tax=Ehrlichia chaffeensis (strain ATCC CRL-10679 / Arkansas) TaxID=205920 RepID=Q2GG10_EHRCR|nr:hypothetical protein ECH_0827 [Ehrlichia chaffeensis str. Arkansas]
MCVHHTSTYPCNTYYKIIKNYIALPTMNIVH